MRNRHYDAGKRERMARDYITCIESDMPTKIAAIIGHDNTLKVLELFYGYDYVILNPVKNMIAGLDNQDWVNLCESLGVYYLSVSGDRIASFRDGYLFSLRNHAKNREKIKDLAIKFRITRNSVHKKLKALKKPAQM